MVEPRRTRNTEPSQPAREIVIKLRRTDTSRRRLRGLLEPGARGPSAAPRGALARLLASDQVESIEPIFPKTAETRAGMRGALASIEDEGEDERFAGLNIVSLRSAAEARAVVERVARDAAVEYAHQPGVRHPAHARRGRGRRPFRRRRASARVDPLRNRQWSLGVIDLPAAQRAGGFNEAFDVPIAVIDTGVDSEHPDLRGIFADEKSFTRGPLRDSRGHGTHVCGILAAATNNGIGISGVCQSRQVISLKGLGPWDSRGYYQALRHAVESTARVINFSLGGEDFDDTEAEIVGAAVSDGIVVVAAMGNEATSSPSYPAALPGVIAVGASNEVDRVTSFSNTGSHITLVAPGEAILSTIPRYRTDMADGVDYESWPGTSMATPIVSATVALMLAKRPSASSSDVRAALERGADKVAGLTRFSSEYGHGRLNVRRSLAAI